MTCHQRLTDRSSGPGWLRLTRFFNTLLLVNIATAVAAGLVQEIQVGMDWSVYSN